MNTKQLTLHDIIKYLRPDIFNLTIDGIKIYDKNGMDEASTKLVVAEG